MLSVEDIKARQSITLPAFSMLCIAIVLPTLVILSDIFIDERYFTVSLCAGITGLVAAIALLHYRVYVLGNLFASTWEIGLYFSMYKFSNLQYEYPETIAWYIYIIGIIPILIDVLSGWKAAGRLPEIKASHYGIDIKRSLIYSVAISSAVLFFAVIRNYGIYFTLGERQMISKAGALLVACETLIRAAYYLGMYRFLFKRDNAILPVIMYTFMYSLLVMSRALMINFIIYFMLIGLISNNVKITTVIVVFILTMVVFGVLGNIREGVSFSIAQYSSINGINSTILQWIYSYICPNFDNLALQIQYGVPSNTPSYLLRPIITTLDLEWLPWYDVSYIYIGRLTLGTFFRDYVCDYGKYALIPFSVTLFSLLKIVYLRNIHFIIKSIVLAEIALAPITNHITQSPFWLSLIVVGCALKSIDKVSISNGRNKSSY